MKKRIITNSIKPYILLEIFIIILLFFFNINNLTFSSEEEKKSIAEIVGFGVENYSMIVPQKLETNETGYIIKFKVSAKDFEKSGVNYQGDERKAIKKRSVYECSYTVKKTDEAYSSLEYIKSRNNETIVNFLYVGALIVLIVIGLNIRKNIGN